MEHFSIAELQGRQRESGARYLEFLRRPAMSLGLYHLRAGAVDSQRPHLEDEIYLVVAGSASIRVDDELVAVNEGDVIYVPAGAEHAFRDIEENLTLLVVFAPAESA